MSQHEDTILHSPSPSPPQFMQPPINPPPLIPHPNIADAMLADNAKWISLLRMIAQLHQPML